jgi:hypothetical protein
LHIVLLLGGEARTIAGIGRHARKLRFDARESVVPGDDARRMNEPTLAALVALFQIEGEGNRDGNGLFEREDLTLRAA